MERYMATCPDEGKEALKKELLNLGIKEIKDGFKHLEFTCPWELFLQCHLSLRTASNLFWIIKEFSAKNEKMLFSQGKRIPWCKYFGSKKTYRVDGILGERQDSDFSSTYLSKAIRLCIEDRFQFEQQPIPKVDLKNPDVIVQIFYRAGKAIVSFNTSGKSLHKRGYRHTQHPAPIKETLAASLLAYAGYDGSQSFLDPMCGSGTIVIEAAMIALDKASNIHRKKGEFTLENLNAFDSNQWRTLQDQLRLAKKEQPDHPIYAADLELQFIEDARANALRARVEKYITFKQEDFFQSSKPCENGIIVTNLPYGERINVKNFEKMDEFYKNIGDHLKQNYKGWTACLLVNEESPWKNIGLKTKRKIPLLNGSIRSKLLIFDLF